MHRVARWLEGGSLLEVYDKKGIAGVIQQLKRMRKRDEGLMRSPAPKPGRLLIAIVCAVFHLSFTMTEAIQLREHVMTCKPAWVLNKSFTCVHNAVASKARAAMSESKPEARRRDPGARMSHAPRSARRPRLAPLVT